MFVSRKTSFWKPFFSFFYVWQTYRKLVKEKWILVKEKVKPLFQESVFIFLLLKNTFLSLQKKKKTSHTSTVWLLQISLSLKSLYWNKIIIIFFFFSLLSATIYIEAHWILLFQETIFLKCLSIICFMFFFSLFGFLVVIMA